MTRLYLLLSAFVLVTAACEREEPAATRVLNMDRMLAGPALTGPVPYAEFRPSPEARAARNSFSGSLELSLDNAEITFELIRDELGLAPGVDRSMATLPEFRFEFVQTRGRIIPVEVGPFMSDHPWWEFVLSAGSVWDEPNEQGFSRANIPFALKERNADCVHNGVLTFLFDDSGRISRTALQVVGQTCRYLQFEMSGLVAADYERYRPDKADAAASAFIESQAHRMEQRPLAGLAEDYPGANPDEFGSGEEIDPRDMTVYGFVIDGVHYTGGCDTRVGAYPDCDALMLPSYSTAKSLVAGLALMRAEKLHPGFRSTPITDVVPECGDSWHGVTIEHALDMTTGHYGSAEMHVDEDSAIVSRFFTAEDHATRIDFACNEFPKRAPPGQHWVYQTWATYLAGTAINNRLRTLHGGDIDFYDELLVRPIWRALHLSRVIENIRRTRDEAAQPFSGFGLTMTRDDVAKLAQFIGADDGMLNGEEVLDAELFEAIKQRQGEDPGLVAELPEIRYNNGFRTFDVSGRLNCPQPAHVTVLSGFGGINIVLMPNQSAYYYFSDGNVHRYLHAVREAHRIRPLC